MGALEHASIVDDSEQREPCEVERAEQEPPAERAEPGALGGVLVRVRVRVRV